MTDAAPAAAPEPAPDTSGFAPIPHEVAVDPNPVSPPAPIGSQAPPMRGPREASIDKSIDRAFARARGNGEKAPVAKAGMGHNNPPEAMEREPEPPKSEAPREKFDLRKRPQEGPTKDQATNLNSSPPAARGGQPAPAADANGAQRSRRPEFAAYRDPPQGMDQRARDTWHAVPNQVRREVHRMHQEYSNVVRNAQADVEAMHSIRPYHDLARSQGTTLPRALNNYVTMENKLRSDPIGGLDVLVHNLNLRTSDGRQITLPDIAHYVLSQTPDQHRALQSRNVQSAHNSQINQLQNTVGQLANHLQRMQYQQAFSQQYHQTCGHVDRFAETHPRLDELADVIVAELKAGYDLPAAYQRATLLRPTTAATQRHVALTRSPDRSISGAPGGPRADARRSGPRSLDDSIAYAMRRVRGSL